MIFTKCYTFYKEENMNIVKTLGTVLVVRYVLVRFDIKNRSLRSEGKGHDVRLCRYDQSTPLLAIPLLHTIIIFHHTVLLFFINYKFYH